MKTIIAGSRTITDLSVVTTFIERAPFMSQITEVFSGAAPGVDQIGERWAEFNRLPIKKFPAQWHLFGKSAGPRRNKKMVDEADALIAIWDGKSRGTANVISLAKERNLKIFIAIL